MSALAFVLQDASGAIGFASRKTASAGAHDDKGSEDFADVLTLSANEATDATPATGSSGAAQKIKDGGPDLLAKQASDDAAAATGAVSADSAQSIAAATGDAGLWRDLASFAAKGTTSTESAVSSATLTSGLTTTARLALNMAAARLTAAGAAPDKDASRPAASTLALASQTADAAAATATASRHGSGARF